MNVTPDSRLALNPEFLLKDDVDRAVLITRPKPLSSANYICRLVHPSEAVVLALMNGERTVRELGELWADLTDKTPAEGAAAVNKLLTLYTTGDLGGNDLLMEVDDTNRGLVRQYDPLDFVVPASRVDVTDPRLRKPYMVYYLPSMFCPQKCIYCYAKILPRPEGSYIPLERLREVFAELVGLGVEVIQMSGGDVFARKDIFGILEAVFAAGLTVDLPTKLGLSYDEALRLKELGVRMLQVSLDSAEPAVIDHMVGVNGYHRRVFRVLDALRRAEMPVRINCVLTPVNLPTIRGLIDYLGGLGNVVRVSLTPYTRSLFCHSDELFVPEEELGALQELADAAAERHPHMRVLLSGGRGPEPESMAERVRMWKKRALCTANRHGFILLPDGRVTVCEELYDHPDFIIGDLRRQSVMEMWRSPEALALIHPDQAAVPDGPCRTCGAFAECHETQGRCWRDVLKSYGWDKPYYPDPRCPQAPAGNRLA